MKGIILAGGAGTRLYPCTLAVSKQILPIYDKPMIYYPVSTLMLAGIKEILIISTPRDIEVFKALFNDGQELGLNIEYAVQEEPRGLAEAFIIGEQFIGDDSVCLVLGDNLFFGYGFTKILLKAKSDIINEGGAKIFGCYVNNPQEFGVVEFDEYNRVISLEEKPNKPKSHYAVPGLYFYDNEVIKIAKNITPSLRGEIEITDINKTYLKAEKLNVELLGRGLAWLDTGTHRSMLAASNFVEAIQSRQGLYVACLEEIAYRQGFIDKNQLIKLASRLKSTEYGQYLQSVADNF
ncbi:glucose-1-phosphate thymidylyltransferase RfbA [Cellulosilyticum sp. ST5]|uniref:glucose-1-phosphate thymidylyltransferase RfbA n=1 Tax=unclassified Cellulosilyticum TaxID=2643091 RepID=UPI000F8F366D|nr:glucose-1-phosphate thymidylyltransferase RfbA [Cellulosilyticum sp. WCF-2]QEH66978.1 glucose-1-phosphate thymidylyltransferase RfbA [Cellulosilyticum sp. WCF-2]